MTGYILCADILGFRQIIVNLAPDEATRRVEEWTELVSSAVAECGVADYQTISDTLFAAAPSTEDGLRRLVNLSRRLLNDGVRRSLPIRGGIAHGEYVWGALTHGRAIVDAHEIEMSQDWIGVAGDASLPHVANLWGLEGVACYPAPRKTGPIRLVPAVVWDVPPFEELAGLITKRGLTKENDTLNWEWARKVDQTTQFGLYLQVLRSPAGPSPEKFWGRLPIEAIAMNFRGAS